VEFKTEKGVLTEKTCPVINFIRYKFADSGEKDQETDRLVNEIGLESVKGFEGKVSFVLKITMLLR
jgi:hypothetical protein